MTKLNLKQLKKELQKKQKLEKEALLKEKARQVEEKLDHNIFQEAMSGVTPLSHDKAYHETKKTNTKPFQQLVEEELHFNDPLSDELEIEEKNPEEILSFCRTGIQKSVFKKLRSGGYKISDELDLHGASLRQAKQLLVYYLQEAVQFESCCIRIIHGKGHRSGSNKPVLKTHVNHWLSEHDRVLAFHSAKPKDGGTGAVYILLKTQNS